MAVAATHTSSEEGNALTVTEERKDPETGDPLCFLAFVYKYDKMSPGDLWERWQQAEVVTGHRALLRQRSETLALEDGIEPQRREIQPIQRSSEAQPVDALHDALALVPVYNNDASFSLISEVSVTPHGYSDSGDAGGDKQYECLIQPKKKRKHDVRPELWRFSAL